MASLNWLSSSPFDPGHIFTSSGVTRSTTSPTSVTYITPTGTVVVTGSSFSFDQEGEPTGGFITSVVYSEGSTVLGRFDNVDNASLVTFHQRWLRDKLAPTYSLLTGVSDINLNSGDDTFGLTMGSTTRQAFQATIDGAGGVDSIPYYQLALVGRPDSDTTDFMVLNSQGGNGGSAKLVRIGSNFHFTATVNGDRPVDVILKNIELLSGVSLVQHVQYDPSPGVHAIVRGSAFEPNTIALNSTLIPGLSIDQTVEITGGWEADSLTGHSGRDVIHGDQGDTLIGGKGDDTYYVSGGATVIETAGNGYDTIKATTTFVLQDGVEIERIEAIGRQDPVWGITFEAKITGNSLANTLIGDIGDSTLDGGGGADRLEGGFGNDTYYVDSKDVVVELSNQGYDTVLASDRFAARSAMEIEVLRFASVKSTQNYYLYGSHSDNTIIGNAGNNALKGLNGNDKLSGGLGNDAIWGGNGNDKLDGGNGVDRLRGDAGNDTLYGGSGNDMLWGGVGRDTFVFNKNLNSRTNVDRIYDFSSKDDTIWLDSRVFRGLEKGKLIPGSFVIGSEPNDASDHIIYDPGTGSLSFDIDGTGNVAPILFAILKPNTIIRSHDFLVV